MAAVTAFRCEKCGAQIHLFSSLSELSKTVENENFSYGIILILKSVLKEPCF